MGDHFSVIGIPITSEDHFFRVTGQLCGLAQVDRSAGIHRQRTWRDPSGAAIAFHLDEHGDIRCLTPFFAPPRPSLWRATNGIPRRDPTCVYCSGADFDFPGGSCYTRATIQLVDFTDWHDGPRAETLDLAVSAFASEVQVFDDEDAYRQAQADPANEGFHLAEESFLPVGMFGPAGRSVEEAACALFTGTILQHEALDNERFGQLLFRLQVATLPGPIDVLYGAQEGQMPCLGGIALVRAWLVGRVGTGRLEDPRG